MEYPTIRRVKDKDGVFDVMAGDVTLGVLVRRPSPPLRRRYCAIHHSSTVLGEFTKAAGAEALRLFELEQAMLRSPDCESLRVQAVRHRRYEVHHRDAAGVFTVIGTVDEEPQAGGRVSWAARAGSSSDSPAAPRICRSDSVMECVRAIQLAHTVRSMTTSSNPEALRGAGPTTP